MSPNTNMTISLSLKAFDNMSNVIGGAINKSNKEFDKLQRKIQKTSDIMQKAGKTIATAGAGMLAGGISLGAALGLGDTIPQAIETEKRLREIGNVGNLTTKSIQGLNSELDNISKYTNQTRPELLETMNFYTAQGITDIKKLTEMTKIAGKVATAESANITEVATAAYRVTDNLKVPVSQLNKTMNILAQSGKEGSFELKNMAQYFPQLTASASALGMKGVSSVAQLGASLQIAMKGAGDAGTAANNFANFLGKINMPSTFMDLGKLEKKGFKGLTTQWEAALKAKDPVYEIVKLVQKLNTEGIKTTEIFQDKQVLDFVNPMLKNIKEYERIKSKSLAASGVVDSDFVNMSKTIDFQWTKLKISMNNFAQNELPAFLKNVNSLLTKINSNPILQKGLFTLIVGLTGGGLLLTTLGGASYVIGKMTGYYGDFLISARNLTPAIKENIVNLMKLIGLEHTATKFGTGQVAIYEGAIKQLTFRKALMRDLIGLDYKYQMSKGKNIWGTNIKDVIPNSVKNINAGMKKGLLGMDIKDIFVIGSSKIVSAFSKIPSLIKVAGLAIMNFIPSIISGLAAIPGVGWVAAGVIAVIVGSALLIYKYWKPITAFFRGFWIGIKNVVQSSGLDKAFLKLGKNLYPLIGWVGDLWNWFMKLVKPVNDTKNQAASFGVIAAQSFRGAINWVTKFINGINSLIEWIKKAGNIFTNVFHGNKGLSIKVLNNATNSVTGGYFNKLTFAKSAGKLPKFDVGSRFITQTGLSVVHRGEEIAPAGTVKSVIQRQNKGSVTISAPFSPNITLKSGNPEEIKRIVREMFSEYTRHFERTANRAQARAY